MSGVVINHVTKSFENENEPSGYKYVLKDVNLSIRQNEFICILGKSGCGKSTLLNLLAGYLKPNSGEIFGNGKEVVGPSADRGVVFQEHALFPWYTVEENIMFGPKIKKQSNAKKIAEKYIKMIGLEDYKNKYPNSLSGGMAQRVGIARALANDPDLLLMDEPLGALDAMTRENMRLELIKIWQKTRKTIIFITHSVPEAVYLADRVILLKEGVVDMDVEIEMERPRDTKSAEFLELVSLFEKGLTDNPDSAIITE